MKFKLKPQSGLVAVGLMAAAAYAQTCYQSSDQACATAGQLVDAINIADVGATTLTAFNEWTFPWAQTAASGATSLRTITGVGSLCGGKAKYEYNGAPETMTWWEAGSWDFMAAGFATIPTGVNGYPTETSGTTCS
jgi:hypothetical protein